MAALHAIGLDEMWRRGLPRLLEKVDVVLACWSKNYASRFTPDQTDPSAGQYVRDETEDARDGEYLVHVILDPVESFPPPYATLEDRQRLKLYTLEGDKVATENVYDHLVQLIKKNMRVLGSNYNAHAWNAIRLLDRGQQEEPLRPHVVQKACPGLYILFGPQVEVPEQLYDRFCLFTMPANGEHRGDRAWMDIVKDYISGELSLKPWERPPVPWPRVTIDPGAGASGYDNALLQIANDLYKLVPRISDNRADDPLHCVLQSIRNSGEQSGISYFAYSFISADHWASERATICALIEKLGSELAGASVDNFRFLVVIERAEIKRGFLRRLLGRTSSDVELGKKEGGPSPAEFEGRPIWYRLPDLTPVQKPDFDAWALLLSAAWGIEIGQVRQSLESFTGKFTSFAHASEELVTSVLRELWRQASLNLNKRSLKATT
jgi:hypothetical protein